MKITLLVSMLAIIILTIIGCDSDILYSPIAEAYKNITVPIVQASDLQ